MVFKKKYLIIIESLKMSGYGRSDGRSGYGRSGFESSGYGRTARERSRSDDRRGRTRYIEDPAARAERSRSDYRPSRISVPDRVLDLGSENCINRLARSFASLLIRFSISDTITRRPSFALSDDEIPSHIISNFKFIEEQHQLTAKAHKVLKNAKSGEDMRDTRSRYSDKKYKKFNEPVTIKSSQSDSYEVLNNIWNCFMSISESTLPTSLGENAFKKPSSGSRGWHNKDAENFEVEYYTDCDAASSSIDRFVFTIKKQYTTTPSGDHQLCLVCTISRINSGMRSKPIYHSSFYLRKIFNRPAWEKFVKFQTSGLHMTSDLDGITRKIWFELDDVLNIFKFGIPREYDWRKDRDPVLQKLISIKFISNIFKILGLAFNSLVSDLATPVQEFVGETRTHGDVETFRYTLEGGKNIKQLSKPKKPTVKPKKPSVKPKKPTDKPKKPTVKPKKPSVKPKKPTVKPKKPSVKPKKPANM